MQQFMHPTDGGSDERNYHAHIMFTTRAIDPENGEFSAKKYRDFSRDSGTETVCHWREYFADLTNDHLAKAGFAVRVDHRSYKDQKNGLEATTRRAESNPTPQAWCDNRNHSQE